MLNENRRESAINPVNSICKGFCIVVLILMLAVGSMAQSAGTGAITGTVTDASGAVVPNVTVTVTSLDTAQVRTATTGGNGSYQVNLLLPGNYRVKFEAAGFQSSTFASVSVTVTETGTLNAQMQVGSQTQQVTVEANVETVQTATSTLGTVVGSTAVVELPLNTRNFTNLIAMSAGANATVNNATSLGKGYQAVSVNGASSAQNNFQMDGVSINNYIGNGTQQELGTFGGIIIPPPDTIQEFKIQTSTYDASYGRNSGANVNLVTKSGTNAYHGTAFEFFRNTKLNANDFFIKNSEVAHLSPTGAASPLPNKEGVLNQNQFGGVFGGPIKKDKLFFFVSYQRTWQKNGLADSAGAAYNIKLPPIPSGPRGSCPTTATLLTQCDGPSQTFAAALGASMCPANNPNSFNLANSSATPAAQLSPLASQTGLQLHCNGDDVNLVALRILQIPAVIPGFGNYYIQGSGQTPSAANNYGYVSQTESYPAYYFEHQGMANIDYVLNSKNTLSGKFYYGSDPNSSNFSDALTVGPYMPGGVVGTQYVETSGVLKLTTIITNNLVNEARYTYQRNTINQYNTNTFRADSVGMTNIGNPGLPQLPFIQITGSMYFGVHNFSISDQRNNTFFASDQISWTHGRHTVRAGGEWEHELYYWNYPAFGIGLATIPSWGDFLVGLPGACGTASTTAPFTCNGTTNSNINAIGSGSDRFLKPQLISYFYSWAVNSFVQDDIKVNPRLTVNLGLRWEYDPLVADKNGASVGLWFSQVQTQPIPGTGCVYNGVTYGSGGPLSNCSFAGYTAAANYNTNIYPALPPGVYKNFASNQMPHDSTPLDNFGPRFGFAWQPLSTNKIVVRGGVGYFFTRLNGGQLASGIKQDPPIAASLNLNGTSQAFASLASPFATTPAGFVPRWANLANGTSQNLIFGGSGGAIQQNFTTPLAYQYNLNVQYEFAHSWVLELGYVGSHGIHQYLVRHQNGALLANIANPLYQASGTPLTTSTTAGGVTSTNGAAASACAAPPCASAAIRAPQLGLTNAFVSEGTDGSYLFNSLQATVRKQLSHGLQLQAAYTYSRAFTTLEQGNPNASFTNNVPVILKYALNPLYHPHRLIMNYTWSLPFGKHEGLTDKLLSGWQLSGVTTIQDGTPLTITSNGLGSLYGTPVASNAQLVAGKTYANVVTAGSVEQRIGGYLTPVANAQGISTGTYTTSLPASALPGCTAPSVITTCTGNLYGSTGFGFTLGPGQNNYDMSLSKITRVGGLREDATLQFRAEFFNTFNHAQFANPTVLNISTGGFGTINQTSVNPRLIQLALKYAF